MIGHESVEPNSVADYSLHKDEVLDLTGRLIQQNDSVSDRYQYITVEVSGEDTFSNIGRHIEGSVFQESFGNDAQEMKEEYGPYEHASTFFLSLDRKNQIPTGVLRIIANSSSGLKTLNDVQSEPFVVATPDVRSFHSITDMDSTWDIGTVAVPVEHRSAEGSVSVQLYRAMYLAALNGGIEHFVSIIDDKPLKAFKLYLGIPFKPLAGVKPGSYLGSKKSHPVYGYVPEFYEKMDTHAHSMRGFAARKALSRLVYGSEDDSIVLKE